MGDRSLRANLTSYFLFSKHCIPMLLKSKGCIINMASVQGSASQPGIPSYAAAKGGILSFTRQLAVEYAPQGLRVNSVSPGTIRTPLVQGILKRRGTNDLEAGAAYPMKRIGEVYEIASMVMFLASKRASFVTGKDFVVDGGVLSKGPWAEVA